jgi:hypothetical protein
MKSATQRRCHERPQLVSKMYYYVLSVLALMMKTGTSHSKKQGLASWDNGFKFVRKNLKSLNDKWFEKKLSYTFGIYFLNL